LTEMELTADHLLVIGRGRLLADGPVEEVVARGGGGSLEEAVLELTAGAVEYRGGPEARR
ncbi:ABC transporter ATP-binding protein, partial [Streptomyces sp. NPDC002454]